MEKAKANALRHSTDSMLIAAGDIAGLASALRSLIEDPELRRRLGTAGRQRAEREFAPLIAIAETLAVYAELRG